MRRRNIVSILAGGAIALPLLAFGHGTEFLDARFEFDSKGAVLLQVTADYSGNPMIADEAEARTVLADALRVEFDGAEHKLSDLAPLNLEPRAQPDPESPLPRAPVDPSLKHLLLCAVWQWEPTTKALKFLVPTESNQTAIFWLHEPGKQEPKWSMLIAGDRTPEIKVPAKAQAWPVVAIIALGVLAIAWWRSRAKPQRGGTE